ncbi:cation transporter [bacterium]|nr:cation transporter [bacterium]
MNKKRAALLSIASNSALVVLKLIVGAMSGSVAVISEAVHSATDLLASVIAYLSVRMSDNPPDADHPYGHGKIESISSLAEALLIFGAALFIIHESVTRLQHPHTTSPQLGPAIAVMALSVLANFFLSRHLRKVALQTDSLALLADAEHLHVDVLTAAGVFFGLILTQVTRVDWLDPLVALGVAVLILQAAWDLTSKSLSPLMDACLPPAEENLIRVVLNSDERVLGYHKLRTRKSGSQRHVDLHVQLDDDCSLVVAHEITEDLEQAIREVLPAIHINIHVEPFLSEMQHQLEVHGTPPEEVNLKYHPLLKV